MSCCQRLILADKVIDNGDGTFQEIEVLYSGDLIAVEQAATVNGFGIINPSAIGTITVLKTKCTYCRALGTSFDAFIDSGFSRQRVTLTYKSEDSEGYTYEVKTYSWQDKAKDVRLWDLMTFDPYIHSEQTIHDSHTSDDYKYSVNNTNGGTDKGYWFPHIFFGGLHKKVGTEFSHSQLDFRPIIARRKLLEDAFCAIGLNYESFAQQQIWDGRDFDYLAGGNCESLASETIVFTKLNLYTNAGETWAIRERLNTTVSEYFLQPDILKVKANKKLYNFKAETTADKAIIEPQRDFLFGNPANRLFDNDVSVNFDNQIYDTGDSINGGFWGDSFPPQFIPHSLRLTQGEWNLKFRLVISAPKSAKFRFQAICEMASFPYVELIQSELIQVHEFEFDLKYLWGFTRTVQFQVEVIPNYSVIPTFSPTVTVKAGSTIEGYQKWVYISAHEPKARIIGLPTVWETESTFDVTTSTIVFPQSYIDENLTLYDYIGGIAHQLNGFTTQDVARGTLSIEPQHPIFWTDVEAKFLELIEGKYQLGTPDIDFSKTCDVNRFIDAKDAKKGLLIGYKKGGTNAYAKGFGDNYAAAIFGDVNDLQENRNPFYSPAYDREYIETRPAGELAIFVPALLDNEKGESLSTALAYFSLYNYGRITQWESDSAGVAIPRLLRRWIGGNVLDTNAVAYSSHIPLAKKTYLVAGVPQFEQYQPLLSYGDVSGNLYETNRLHRFHESDTGAATYSGDFNLKFSEYQMLDFTKRYIISDGCNTVAVRLAKKGGFNCDTNMASLEFRDIIKCNFLNYDFRRQ
jgi:hypothetical protein